MKSLEELVVFAQKIVASQGPGKFELNYYMGEAGCERWQAELKVLGVGMFSEVDANPRTAVLRVIDKFAAATKKKRDAMNEIMSIDERVLRGIHDEIRADE